MDKTAETTNAANFWTPCFHTVVYQCSTCFQGQYLQRKVPRTSHKCDSTNFCTLCVHERFPLQSCQSQFRQILSSSDGCIYDGVRNTAVHLCAWGSHKCERQICRFIHELGRGKCVHGFIIDLMDVEGSGTSSMRGQRMQTYADVC